MADTFYCAKCKTHHVSDQHLTDTFYKDLEGVEDNWMTWIWTEFWGIIRLLIGPKLNAKFVAFVMRRMGWLK